MITLYLHEPVVRRKSQGRRDIDGVNLPAPAASGPAEVFALHKIDNPVFHKPVVRRELDSKESRLISLLPFLDDDDNDDGDDEGE